MSARAKFLLIIFCCGMASPIYAYDKNFKCRRMAEAVALKSSPKRLKFLGAALVTATGVLFWQMRSPILSESSHLSISAPSSAPSKPSQNSSSLDSYSNIEGQTSNSSLQTSESSRSFHEIALSEAEKEIVKKYQDLSEYYLSLDATQNRKTYTQAENEFGRYYGNQSQNKIYQIVKNFALEDTIDGKIEKLPAILEIIWNPDVLKENYPNRDPIDFKNLSFSFKGFVENLSVMFPPEDKLPDRAYKNYSLSDKQIQSIFEDMREASLSGDRDRFQELSELMIANMQFQYRSTGKVSFPNNLPQSPENEMHDVSKSKIWD